MPIEKKIHVDELRVGMYVCKLDRPWLDTPFPLQGVFIEDASDARMVKQYSEYVWIDAESEKTCEPEPISNSEEANNAIPREVCIEEEHQRVQEDFKEARRFTRDLLDDVRLGQEIEQQAAQQTVEDCVESVLRNPDALIWMSKIREESEYTAQHSLNVCILAVVFGRSLGLRKDELEILGLCGLLHDIGKMRVPLDILDKPGKLTTKEMNMMKAHTVHGRNLLMSTPSVSPMVVDASYSHHERIDGQGYPRKMPGDQIAYFTRIISVVDAYDAMTSDRCYSKAMPTTKALKIIYEERGKQFDEELALQFIKTIGLFPIGSIVELYTGELGIVIEANPRYRHLPRVILVRDNEQQDLSPYKMVDLDHIVSGDLNKDHLIKHVWPDGHEGVYLKEYQQKGILLKY